MARMTASSAGPLEGAKSIPAVCPRQKTQRNTDAARSHPVALINLPVRLSPAVTRIP
jgi:hypothetical protein